MGLACPLCLEPLDPTDRRFYPCPCKYQLCLWCYQKISEGDKRCPKCRQTYDGKNHATPFSEEDSDIEEDEDDLKANRPTASDREITYQRKQTPLHDFDRGGVSSDEFQSQRRRFKGGPLSGGAPPQGILPGSADSNLPRDLRDVRVVRRELCYVVGVPPEVVADEEALKDFRWLGKYGPVANVIVNRNPNFKAPDKKKSCAVYVTFQNFEDAKMAIMDLDDSEFDGRHLRASYGTTKYCSSFLRNLRCQNRTCFYLHERGRDEDSFTVAQMNQVKETSRGLTCSALLASEFEAANWKDGIFNLFGKDREETIAYFVSDPRGRQRPPLATVAAEVMRLRNPPPSPSLVIMTPPPPKIDTSAAVHPALRWSGEDSHYLLSGDFFSGESPATHLATTSTAAEDDAPPGSSYWSQKRTSLDFGNDLYNEVGPVKLPPQQPSSLLSVYVTPADAQAVCRPPVLRRHMPAYFAPPPGLQVSYNNNSPRHRRPASYADAACYSMSSL